MGTAARGERNRPPARRARPLAHNVPVEGRRARRRRAPDTHRSVDADARRLLKHLAFVEDHASTMRLNGSTPGAPWRAPTGARPTGSSCHRSTTPTASSTRCGTGRSRDRFDDALAGGLDQLVHTGWPDGRKMSLRRLLFDLVEEYGRHTGHTDLLREAVDSRTGEDPPPGWRPESPGGRRSARDLRAPGAKMPSWLTSTRRV